MDYEGLNKERVFLEGLFQQRFNFFLVAFGLVLTAGSGARSQGVRLFVLVNGILFCFFLWLCVYRICRKVDAVLKMLHEFQNESFHQVHMRATEKPGTVQANEIMGGVIPFFAVTALTVWLVLTAADWLR